MLIKSLINSLIHHNPRAVSNRRNWPDKSSYIETIGLCAMKATMIAMRHFPASNEKKNRPKTEQDSPCYRRPALTHPGIWSILNIHLQTSPRPFSDANKLIKFFGIARGCRIKYPPNFVQKSTCLRSCLAIVFLTYFSQFFCTVLEEEDLGFLLIYL